MDVLELRLITTQGTWQAAAARGHESDARERIRPIPLCRRGHLCSSWSESSAQRDATGTPAPPPPPLSMNPPRRTPAESFRAPRSSASWSKRRSWAGRSSSSVPTRTRTSRAARSASPRVPPPTSRPRPPAQRRRGATSAQRTLIGATGCDRASALPIVAPRRRLAPRKRPRLRTSSRPHRARPRRRWRPSELHGMGGKGGDRSQHFSGSIRAPSPHTSQSVLFRLAVSRRSF